MNNETVDEHKGEITRLSKELEVKVEKLEKVGMELEEEKEKLVGCEERIDVMT